MDPNELLPILQQHGWRMFAVAIASQAIFWFVRGLRDDATVWPFNYLNLDARWRPVAVAIGGIVASLLSKVVSGDTWSTALQFGAAAAIAAMLTHTFGVNVARDGRELFEPKQGGAPRIGERGVATLGDLWWLVLASVCAVAAFALMSCASWKPVARTVNDVARAACELYAVDEAPKMKLSVDDAIKALCATDEALQPFIDDLLASKAKAAAKFSAAHPAK